LPYALAHCNHERFFLGSITSKITEIKDWPVATRQPPPTPQIDRAGSTNPHAAGKCRSHQDTRKPALDPHARAPDPITQRSSQIQWQRRTDLICPGNHSSPGILIQ
jgi:hypothetical protein